MQRAFMVPPLRQAAEKGPSASLAPSAARSTYRKYASRAAVGRRLASGPFSAAGRTSAPTSGVRAALHRDGLPASQAGLLQRAGVDAAARPAAGERQRDLGADAPAPRRVEAG